MPRPLRQFRPQGIYHVYARGNGRDPLFFEDGHRRRFLALMGEHLPAWRVQIVAWCLMTNHFHLAVILDELPLGTPMQRLLSVYAREVNYQRGRSGHLFERRYHADGVTGPGHLRSLIRYIHLNPVRARMCAEPQDYPWSSHRAYLGDPAPAWLSVDLGLSVFGGLPTQARREYQRFIVSCEIDTLEFDPGRALGTHGSAGPGHADTQTVVDSSAEAERTATELQATIRAVANAHRLSVDEVLHGHSRRASAARGELASRVGQAPRLRLADLAGLCGCRVSVLSHAARRHQERTPKR